MSPTLPTSVSSQPSPAARPFRVAVIAGDGIGKEVMPEGLRVLRAADDLTGDVGRAIFWYRNEPLPPFNYKTAEQLVSEGRAEDVLRYVESLEAGAAG